MNHCNSATVKLPNALYEDSERSSISNTRDHVTYIYEIIHICTAVVDESEEWSSQLIFQFKQLERRSLKNQVFNGIRTRDLRDTGAMLYQLSYKATDWERGQFIEFISSRAVKLSDVYIWNNSYLYCGCRWKWRMIIAVNFPREIMFCKISERESWSFWQALIYEVPRNLIKHRLWWLNKSPQLKLTLRNKREIKFFKLYAVTKLWIPVSKLHN